MGGVDNETAGAAYGIGELVDARNDRGAAWRGDRRILHEAILDIDVD
jgi:hypothetical protein